MSITTLGSAIGGFFGGFASDFYGRRTIIVASDVIFILGAVLMGFAQTDTELIFGRAVVGIAIGVASIVVPIYIAEVSPKGIRAMLIVLYSVQIGVGLCLAFAGGFAFTFTPLTWRAILAAPVVPAVLQLVMMAYLPESPRWRAWPAPVARARAEQRGVGSGCLPRRRAARRLALQGKLAEAETVLRHISTTNSSGELAGGEDAKETEAELKDVYKEGKYLRSEEGQREAWNLRPRPIVIQLLLGVGLSCLHSLAGARTIMYYSLEIIQMAGFNTELAIMQSIFTMGSFGTLGLALGFFLIDRIGRRALVIASGIGTTFSLALLSASFYFAAKHSPAVAPTGSPEGYNTCGLGQGGGAITTCSQCLQVGCGYCSLPPGIPGQYHDFPGHCFAGVAPGNSSALTACESLDGSLHLYKDGCPSGFGWMSMAALCLYQTFFQLGLGLIPAVVNAEYYPARVRGLCNGIAVASNWLSNFFVSSSFLTLDQVLGDSATFGIYGATVAVGTAILAFTLPETSGLSFPEIQAMFEQYGQPGAPPPWRLHEGRPRQEKKGGTLPVAAVGELLGGGSKAAHKSPL